MAMSRVQCLTGGTLGLIQLSDKFRMEIGHALFTVFLGWLWCLFGTFDNLSSGDYQVLIWLVSGDYQVLIWFLLSVPQVLLSFGLVASYNLSDEEDSTLSLPTVFPLKLLFLVQTCSNVEKLVIQAMNVLFFYLSIAMFPVK
ncbi:unnamed protein product [Arabidopsis halleri]